MTSKRLSAVRDGLFVFLIIAEILSISLIAPCFGAEPVKKPEIIIVQISVNTESKGEFFVRMTGDGQFFIRQEDLGKIGINNTQGTVELIDGEKYIAGNSIKGMRVEFDPQKLTLSITAEPELLGKRVIDLSPAQYLKVYYPKGNSVFLNYRLEYGESDVYPAYHYSLINELGVRAGAFLIYTDTSYTNYAGEERFVRLMSNVTYDERKDMKRFIAGDLYTSSGEFGSSLNIGGFTYSKLYRMDPYFIRYPTAAVSGFSPLPSQVDVYMNGNRVFSDRMSPGFFDLQNIKYFGGSADIDVVIKDAFGREEHISYPYYFADTMLKQGLHEYQYSAGFIRENFGVESNDYGKAAATMYHKYGWNNWFNLGFRGEASKEVYNGGPLFSVLFNGFGITSAALSASHSDTASSAMAFSVGHVYQSRRVSAYGNFKLYSRDYATIAPVTEQIQSEAKIGGGYGSQPLGVVSAGYGIITRYDAGETKIISANYSRQLVPSVIMSLSYQNIRDETSNNIYLLTVTWYPKANTSVSGSYLKDNAKDVETIQVQKNAPVGEGFGYRAIAQRTSTDSTTDGSVDTTVQYNSKYGIHIAEMLKNDYGESYLLTTAGAIVYINGKTGVTRPVSDSFAFVHVDNMPDIPVFWGGQEVARTDKDGTAIIPSLGSFQYNQISIADADVPIEYSMPSVMQYVSPDYRSGVCIDFEISRITAVSGRIRVWTGDILAPLEFARISMRPVDKVFAIKKDRNYCGEEKGVQEIIINEVSSTTVSDGEFYLENITPGTWLITIKHNEKTYTATVIVPEGKDVVTDLGEVVVTVEQDSSVPKSLEK